MTLYLLPNLLHPDANPRMNFVVGLPDLIHTLEGFFVEHEKEARLYLKQFDFSRLRDRPMQVLNKDTTDMGPLLTPLLRGEKWGVISDAGLPCIADPGARLVFAAKEKGVAVEAVPGPSSLFLAIMLSGLDSQSFIFHGYMPRDGNIARMPQLQVFIETPYNNEKTLARLIGSLRNDDVVSIAVDLTLPTQQVITKPILWWKDHPLQFHKRPAIFLIKTRP